MMPPAELEYWTVPDDSLRTAGILAGDQVLTKPLVGGDLTPGWVVVALHGRGSQVVTSLFRVVSLAPGNASIRGRVGLIPLSGVGLITVDVKDILARAVALVRSLDGSEPQAYPIEMSTHERVALFAREMGKRDELLGKCLLTLAAAVGVGSGWLEKLAVLILAEGQVLVDHVYGGAEPQAKPPRMKVH